VIVTGVLDPTVDVVIVNVALVLPAAIVTLDGTLATLLFELLSVTTAPLLPAGVLSVAVPVGFMLPPTTLVGFDVIVVRVGTGAVIARVALLVPRYVAVIVTVASAGLVAIVKVALLLPAVTVTVAGTVAAFVFELESAITVSEVITVSIVTVPVVLLPPVIDEGEIVTLLIFGKRFTVRIADAVLP